MDANKFDPALGINLFIAWALCMAAVCALAYSIKACGRMGKKKPVGGAKLSQKVVDRLRQLGTKCDVAAEARRYQVHPKTVRRILTYETWVAPEPVATDDEHKQCQWCGNVFARRYAGGRWRTDGQWAQKRTCNASCNMYLMWKDGIYINRKH